MFVVTTRNFPPDIGGIQILMEGLSKGLIRHGPVKIFADGFKDSNDYDLNSGLDISRISGFKLFRKYRKANIIADFIKKNINIRAIFSDHWKSIEHINKEILRSIPIFCLIHSKEINHLIGTRNNTRMTKSLAKADFIIANSHFTKNLAIKLGVKENSIKVISPGINMPEEVDSEYNKKAKEIFLDSFPKLITIARLDKRKSHDNIIMAIKNLKTKFPKIKYVSIGSGNEEKNLKDLVRELDLNKEVLFLNQTNSKLKSALTQNSNLFVMPSRIVNRSVEGFGIAFIEAASYGIPSIGGVEGGASDAIKDKITGLICDGSSVGSIYESIEEMINNDRYIKFGKAAKKFAEDFYWNKIIKQYLSLIN